MYLFNTLTAEQSFHLLSLTNFGRYIVSHLTSLRYLVFYCDNIVMYAKRSKDKKLS